MEILILVRKVFIIIRFEENQDSLDKSLNEQNNYNQRRLIFFHRYLMPS